MRHHRWFRDKELRPNIMTKLKSLRHLADLRTSYPSHRTESFSICLNSSHREASYQIPHCQNRHACHCDCGIGRRVVCVEPFRI